MAPFVILGTPRSRTAWLAKFLSYGDVTCHHEPSVHFRSLADLSSLLRSPNTGASDSMMTLLWPEILFLAPNVKMVVVTRPMGEVLDSVKRMRVSVPLVRSLLARIVGAVEEIKRSGFDALFVDFCDLEKEDVCARLFEHTLGLPFDREWWLSWRDVNVQTPIGQRIIDAARNADGIRAVYALAGA